MNQSIKAVTVYEPWAGLIARQFKEYETRSWYTPYRGPLVIHSGKREPMVEEMAVIEDALGKNYFLLMNFGCGLCVCELVHCYPVEAVRDRMTMREYKLGNYSNGRYAWHMKVLKVFERPIPMRGQQGLWDWPEDV